MRRTNPSQEPVSVKRRAALYHEANQQAEQLGRLTIITGFIAAISAILFRNDLAEGSDMRKMNLFGIIFVVGAAFFLYWVTRSKRQAIEAEIVKADLSTTFENHEKDVKDIPCLMPFVSLSFTTIPIGGQLAYLHQYEQLTTYNAIAFAILMSSPWLIGAKLNQRRKQRFKLGETNLRQFLVTVNHEKLLIDVAAESPFYVFKIKKSAFAFLKESLPLEYVMRAFAECFGRHFSCAIFAEDLTAAVILHDHPQSLLDLQTQFGEALNHELQNLAQQYKILMAVASVMNISKRDCVIRYDGKPCELYLHLHHNMSAFIRGNFNSALAGFFYLTMDSVHFIKNTVDQLLVNTRNCVDASALVKQFSEEKGESRVIASRFPVPQEASHASRAVASSKPPVAPYFVVCTRSLNYRPPGKFASLFNWSQPPFVMPAAPVRAERIDFGSWGEWEAKPQQPVLKDNYGAVRYVENSLERLGYRVFIVVDPSTVGSIVDRALQTAIVSPKLALTDAQSGISTTPFTDRDNNNYWGKVWIKKDIRMVAIKANTIKLADGEEIRFLVLKGEINHGGKINEYPTKKPLTILHEDFLRQYSAADSKSYQPNG
jgi:hypothetical protein